MSRDEDTFLLIEAYDAFGTLLLRDKADDFRDSFETIFSSLDYSNTQKIIIKKVFRVKEK